MVKKTHQTIWIVFALFVVYLALVRVVITWAQWAPNQFGETVAWITNSDVSFESLQIQQGWLGVQIEVDEALIEHDGLEIEAKHIAFDFNLFSPLIPSSSWGDSLRINGLAVLEYGQPVKSNAATPSVESFLSLNSQELVTQFDLSRLWKKVEVTDFSASIYQKETDWTINVSSFQAFKGARWSLAADFNVRYGQVLQGERFQLKASLFPGVFGGVQSGDFTVKAFDAIRLERLAKLTPQKWHQVLPQGELIPNLKGTISKSLLSNLYLELSAPGLIWSDNDPRLPKSVGVNLEWKNQAKIYDGRQTDWQFLLSGIQLDDQFIETVSPIHVQLSSKRLLKIETQAFDLKPFKPIVKAILHNEKMAALFDASAELLLKNVEADLAVPELYFENVSADIAALAVPVTNLPGVALQALHVEKRGPDFKFHSNNPIWVMYPTIHPVPMRFDLSTEVTGRFDVPNNSWALDSLELLWDNMAVELNGRGDFSGKLDVQAQLDPKTIAKVKQYLPYSIMTPKLSAWLKAALISGETGRGEFYFNGDLNDYPFKTGETRFGGQVDVQDAQFKFYEGWPILQGLDATVNWSQFDLTILADSLSLRNDVEAKAVKVDVGSLNSKDIAVEFSAKALGKGAATIDYLLDSPLPAKLGLTEMLSDKKKIALTGPVEVSLNKVWVPVLGFKDQAPTVEGSVNLNKNTLRLFDILEFTNSAGLLTFSEKGVKSNKLTALFHQGPAEFRINTNKNGVIQVNASGQSALDYPSIVKGEADWSANVSVPLQSKQSKTAVNLEVDTTKLDWLMPVPLNNTNLNGKFTSTITVIDEGLLVTGDIGQLGSFDVSLESKGGRYAVKKGWLNIGQSKRLYTNTSGLRVLGSLPVLNLDKWATWEFPNFQSEAQGGSFLKSIDWNNSELNVGEVRFIDYPYKDVKLTWSNALDQNFHAELLSKQISTHFDVKPDGNLSVHLDWLQIFLPVNSLESSLTQQERLQLIQSCKLKESAKFVWPNISFTGENIRIDEIGVPLLSFKVEDSESRLHFKDIEASLEKSSGTVTGNYYFYKTSKLSNADLKLKSTNIKDLTRLLGLKKGFSGKRADVSSNIVWQGGLECFNLLGLLGKTEYQLKEGVIEDVEPGFARLLGLLNVTSLARRLSLDLKDLTTKGFAYDTIKGETHFINGKLNLKGFEMKAPSASVELGGDIDLIDREFNLKARVIPALGSSLPALSALTGIASPIGALAVYALMKVIPELNEELVTYTYKVTGPWNAPIIDDGKKPEMPEDKGAIDELLQRN